MSSGTGDCRCQTGRRGALGGGLRPGLPFGMGFRCGYRQSLRWAGIRASLSWSFPVAAPLGGVAPAGLGHPTSRNFRAIRSQPGSEWRGSCRHCQHLAIWGYVVGGTSPAALKRTRQILPGGVILVPGIGSQGGDLRAAVLASVDERGRRAIICASRAVSDCPKGPSRAASTLRADISAVLTDLGFPLA